MPRVALRPDLSLDAGVIGLKLREALSEVMAVARALERARGKAARMEADLDSLRRVALEAERWLDGRPDVQDAGPLRAALAAWRAGAP